MRTIEVEFGQQHCYVFPEKPYTHLSGFELPIFCSWGQLFERGLGGEAPWLSGKVYINEIKRSRVRTPARATFKKGG
jgi:hypothetical protein